jgi:hypothetical protein
MQDDAAEIIAWLATPEGEDWAFKRAVTWVTIFASIKPDTPGHGAWAPFYGDDLSIFEYWDVAWSPDWGPEYPGGGDADPGVPFPPVPG